jgi:hypothetical protein
MKNQPLAKLDGRINERKQDNNFWKAGMLVSKIMYII